MNRRPALLDRADRSQHRRDAFVDHQVGEQLPGGLGQRQVGVITPEDDHRQPLGGAVGGAAQPRPSPDYSRAIAHDVDKR